VAKVQATTSSPARKELADAPRPRPSRHGGSGASLDQDRPKSFTFVSIGPVTTESPSASKKLYPSLLARLSFGRMPFAHARERVGSEIGTSDFLLALDTVGIACERVNARLTVERDAEREQELDAPSTTAVAAHGHRRLATGRSTQGALKGWPRRAT
jgi:hypothetical protein